MILGMWSIKQTDMELTNTDFKIWPNKADILFVCLFPIVFATLQLSVSLELVDRFWWGLL